MAEVPSSKVTVTYWDPSSVFPLIEPDIQSLLPLRNLHWKSPSRPLRSISSLQVELVPYTGNQQQLAPVGPTSNSSSSDLPRARSTEHERQLSIVNPPHSSLARRHQIPGLRQTPYLKVYILRCDDAETYRATTRKMLRDWVATHASGGGVATAGNSSTNLSGAKDANNHDAFEWMIIHVVLPGTSASMQPRSSTSGGTGKGWMKGSQTLLEKIKADFNGTSKNSKDRVVQIRVPSNHPDLTTLSPPVPLTTAPVNEPAAEAEAASQELVSKMKSLILASFDARVSQYEEDVKEKDAQRALPGWNFCTFFLLKEGLARAFEAVGLVVDALAIYDELELGLDTVVGEDGNSVGGFKDWTPEVREWLQNALRRREILLEEGADGGGNCEDSELPFDSTPISSTRKPYREMILSNSISEFDFRVYIFSRQLLLTLRLGCLNSEEKENLTALSDACGRGVYFFNSVARVLESDLMSGWKANKPGELDAIELPQADENIIKTISKGIVASWRYAVAYQIIQETQVRYAPAFPATHASSGPPLPFPKRMSSLPSTPTAETFPAKPTSPMPPPPSPSIKSGLEPLCAGRGELLSVLKTILESFAVSRGWIDEKKGWLAESGNQNKFEVDLNDDSPRDSEERDNITLLAGVLEKSLYAALRDKKEFYLLCEELCKRAIKTLEMSGRERWVTKLRVDLVGLKYQQGDYAAASANLDRLTQSYARESWGALETSLLMIQAKCLKEMGRKQDYLKVLLKLLTKSAEQERARSEKRPGTAGPQISRFEEEDVLPVHGYVSEVVALGKEVESALSVEMGLFFADIQVDQYPRDLEDRDGFALTLSMRYLLKEELAIEGVKVKLVAVSGQYRDVYLEGGPAKLRKGVVRLELETTSTIQATYLVERVELHLSNKVIFAHDTFAKSTAVTPIELTSSTSAAALLSAKASKITFWPSPRTLNVTLRMPSTIRLDKVRGVELVINTGRNQITKGELRIKSGTAGLRLIIGDTTVVGGNAKSVSKTAKAGTLLLQDLDEDTELVLKVPYMAENDMLDLMLKIELDYTTPKGEFLHASMPKVAMSLPLSVNVQDVFKRTALFSKFQISTGFASIPLRIYRTELSESDTFKTTSAPQSSDPAVTFAAQPASYVYKIERKTNLGIAKEKPLEFAVHYNKLDHEVKCGLEKAFLDALEKENLHHLVRILLPPLLNQVSTLSIQQLETIGLLEFVRMDEIGFPWEEVLETVSPITRKTLHEFLERFVESNPKIPLHHSTPQTILIPVDVPSLPLLFTATLSLSLPREPKPLLTTGQAIAGTLSINTTTSWGSPRPGARFECIFEIVAPVDVWLIGGRKRARFVAEDGQQLEFPLLLVPVRAGELLLPNLEINVVGWPQGMNNEPGMMEVDVTSSSETVRVLPDVRSTVVRIEGGERD